MRTWNGILATALAGAALFTSCRKQDMNTNLSPTPTTASTSRVDGGDAGAFISYRITTIPSQDNALIAFSEGSINAKTITLNAAVERGQAKELVYFENTVAVPHNPLFAPINLGNLNIPKGNYAALTFGVTMADDNLNSAMVLIGQYNRRDIPQVQTQHAVQKSIAPIVIKIIVDQPIQFHGDFAPPLQIDMQNYYTMTLYFDPAVAFGGITPDLLDQATLNEGQLIISSEQNPRLYNLIIQNLSNGMRIQFDIKNPLPSA